MSGINMKGGAAIALLSAMLFGLSTPLSKLMIGTVDPWLLAAMLYLASGCGLTLLRLAMRWRDGWQRSTAPREAPLQAADLPWLLAVIASGGVAAPVLLMFGLKVTPASNAALLLNLEGVFTLVLAWVVFRENVDRRLMVGAVALIAGACLLALPAGGNLAFGQASLAGVGLIAGACLCWAIDNNLTRKLSAADPMQITAAKGLVAGGVNLAIALGRGAHLPGPAALAGIGVIGFFCYGISLVLFVHALRHLGAARTGAYYATAPFIGAGIAILLLGESPTLFFLAAALLMALGLYLHLSEAHEHEHRHEALSHDHRHRHDAHHTHDHAPGDPAPDARGMHRHPHRHQSMTHRHRHFPDIHHQHQH
ncbi:MAG TPA: DMT family transporter [Dongiaceae bacterium]|nr:DMT family transporter [Dongiaceae bacterium]